MTSKLAAAAVGPIPERACGWSARSSVVSTGPSVAYGGHAAQPAEIAGVSDAVQAVPITTGEPGVCM